MRPAGEVVRATGGVAVLRAAVSVDPETVDRDDPTPALSAAGLPAAGDEVVDGSLTTVGRVVDAFGPLERPYLAVDAVDPAAHIGERLYVRERQR
ncbi:H/ACA RNA-protein complex component Gar1 [Halobacteriales archaeon SW_7_71_33]|nr:MAG: H/ACA RNA-protein complex component Gar1 [Halobacteriales archaeon SW_7_71_33]